MLIIAGTITVAGAERDAYVADCVPVVTAARAHPGCLAFAITADTVAADLIHIYERWDNAEDLEHFRGNGPSEGQNAQILDATVRRYAISDITDP